MLFEVKDKVVFQEGPFDTEESDSGETVPSTLGEGTTLY